MFFNILNSDYMMHMMDYGLLFWIPMGIGGMCMIAIILIVVYFLTRKKGDKIELKVNNQNLPKSTISDIRSKEKSISYCPDCGARLDNPDQMFCSICGNKL
ncbi:MAG: hypothetical protein ACFFBP_20870 [Promethearchaeota archaeon]